MEYLLPISYDSNAKTVSLSDEVSAKDYSDLKLELDQLNVITKDLINSNVDTPPPPTKESYTKNLSMMIKKMHESAVQSMRQQKFQDAVKQFTVALGLATARPKFESFQGTVSEVMICLVGRCDGYMMLNDWLSAYTDAELLCQLAANIPDNHFRKGTCLMKLGHLMAAKSDFERGLCFKEDHVKLKEQLALVNKLIDVENGDL